MIATFDPGYEVKPDPSADPSGDPGTASDDPDPLGE